MNLILLEKDSISGLECVTVNDKVGMRCKLCTAYGKSPRNRSGSWKKCDSLQELAQQVLSNNFMNELFPLISNLLVHALVLPVSSVECERCFSAINRVKTIRIEGPEDNNFDFKEAVMRWSCAKKPRLFNS